MKKKEDEERAAAELAATKGGGKKSQQKNRPPDKSQEGKVGESGEEQATIDVDALIAQTGRRFNS